MFHKIQEKISLGYLIIFIMYQYYLTTHNGKSRSTTLVLDDWAILQTANKDNNDECPSSFQIS